MIYNKNQLGRILLQHLIEETDCDMQVAIRFFYNSRLYTELPAEQIDGDTNQLYTQLKEEYTNG